MASNFAFQLCRNRYETQPYVAYSAQQLEPALLDTGSALIFASKKPVGFYAATVSSGNRDTFAVLVTDRVYRFASTSPNEAVVRGST